MTAVGSEGTGRGAIDLATPKACPSCATRYPADALFCSLDGAPLTTSPGAIAAAAATDPYVGREILGHIEIRQLVGIGAMGRVYRAFQRGIDRDVAVKILHRELSANQTLVARFHREAKVASRLAHPHVVHVLLIGQLPDGAMYIVMEYLDGMSLQSALAAAGSAIELPRALHIALQLCDAAGEAHSQGIVHRDLKPENVMLVLRADDPDFVKILDFGIARLNWDEPSTATAAGLIFGTARYISPEGAQGERVGPQGDVYSIATMVYQMLAGRTPFDADQAIAILVQQIHDPPASLKEFERASYVPEPVASVVMKNLAKKPADRAPDARALGRALLEAAVSSGLSAQDILARPALLGAERGSHASVVQLPSMQRTKQLSLEPDVAARIGAVAPSVPAAPSEGRQTRSTAYETPAPHLAETYEIPAPHPAEAYETPAPAGAHGRTVARTEIADPETLPPTAGTTRWTPGIGLESRLSTVPPSEIEATMDDQQALRVRASGASSATAFLPAVGRAPLPTAAVAPPFPSAGRPPPLPTAAASAPASPAVRYGPPTSFMAAAGGSPAPQAIEPAPPIAEAPRASVPTSPAARNSSPVDATLAGEPRAAGRRARRMTLVVLYFLLGAFATAAVAWRAGLLRKSSATARAAAGFREEPGPEAVPHGEPAGVDLQGDLRRTAAQGTVAPEPLATAAAQAPVPPLTSSVPTPASVALATGASRLELDVSEPRPGVGLPVDFAVRVVGGSGAHKVDAARFRIRGPGLSGTELAATDDGSGVLRTTFTFLQAGSFEVRFTARVDGSPMSTSRILVVGDAANTLPSGPAPPVSEPGSTSDPAAKWL